MWALCCGASRLRPSIVEIDFSKQKSLQVFSPFVEGKIFFASEISIGIFLVLICVAVFFGHLSKGYTVVLNFSIVRMTLRVGASNR